MQLFAITWEEGPLRGGPYAPYIQSERVSLGVYKSVAEAMVEKGQAFYCQCEARNAKSQGYSNILRDPCREKRLTEGAIKLKVPENTPLVYHDFIFDKDVTWDSSTVGDTTLLKSDGFPTYHLAAMVDDVQMKITHILRGHDWLPSTPIHLLVFKFLEYTPEIGHLTDILDPEGGKLSKRKGSVSCEGFLAEGYLPEAILNFIMLLGWAPKDNRELFSLEEFVASFQQGSLQTANPVFNRKKLDWFNGVYLRKKTEEELFQLIEAFAPKGADENLVRQTIPLVKERMVKLSDYSSLAGFFFEEPKVPGELFDTQAEEQLSAVLEVLKQAETWSKEILNQAFAGLIQEKKWQTGDFFMNLRVALAGSRATPPITESMVILGKQETLSRLNSVIKSI